MHPSNPAIRHRPPGRRRRGHLIALVITTALVLTACGAGAQGGAGGASEDELRIGVIADLTGPAAPFGIPEADAAKYLAEQANEDGGVDGRKVTVIVKDGRTDPTDAAKAARELMLEDQVHAIIGPTTGSAALAVGPLAAANQVPVVAPVGTISVTDESNEFYDWMFRSSINDLYNVDAELALIKDLGAERLAVFFQQDAYGESTTERVHDLVADEDGLEVVAEASAPLTATDLSAQATRISSANPEAILVQASAPTVAAALLRALDQAGSDAKVVVSGGLTTQSFIDAASGAAEGVYAVGAVGWDKPTKNQADFINGYGNPKNFGEAIAGTAFMAITAAAQDVDGELTGESLRDAIEQLCPFPTLTKSDGCFSPDDHDGGYSGADVRVVDGTWVTVH